MLNNVSVKSVNPLHCLFYLKVGAANHSLGPSHYSLHLLPAHVLSQATYPDILWHL